MVLFLIATVLSLFVGLSLGVIGAGGSILTVPILHYVLGLDAVTSTALSLAVVGVTAAAAMMRYQRNNLIAWKEGLLFALPSLVSVASVRAIVVPSLPGEVVLIPGVFGVAKDTLILASFSIVMFVASLAMLKPQRTEPPEATVEKASMNPASHEPRATATAHTQKVTKLSFRKMIIISLEGVLVGAVTGFVGAGGGFLIVPALNLLVGLSMKVAIGTSLMIIAFKSLLGFFGDIGAGVGIPWATLGVVTAASLLGMRIGLHVSHRVSGQKLKPIFGVFVLVMSVVLLVKEIF